MQSMATPGKVSVAIIQGTGPSLWGLGTLLTKLTCQEATRLFLKEKCHSKRD